LVVLQRANSRRLLGFMGARTMTNCDSCGVLRVLLLAAVYGFAATACDSGTDSPGALPPAAAPGAASPAAAPDASPGAAALPPPVPPPAVTQASWAPDALEELLAPIALYPDALLGQILTASVNSQEVLDAGNWLLENQSLTGTALDMAAEQAGFGPAMRALVQFPTVVDMMCQELDWTRQLGSAFSSDQAAVLDAVQRLRAQAVEVGNLKTTPEQVVESKPEGDKVVVEVKPADPQIVYVPQYNPQVVYTQPPPPAQTTTTTTTSGPDAATSAALGFGAGILLAAVLDDDDCCYPHWGSSVVFVGPRPFYPPAYVYRPAYGPAFRPAYGYAPPPGYRHNYVNNNVNININNNNNYYNRFDNNRNINGGTQSPLAQRPTTYQGARNDAVSSRLGEAAGGRASTGAVGQRPAATTGARTGAAAGAAGAAGAAARTTDRSYHADRGYGNSTRSPNLGPSGTAPRPAATPTPRATPTTPTARPTPQREQAFTGAAASGNGSFERAASARGHASAAHLPQRGGGGGGRRR
jgi:hypothetical protein